MTPDFPDERVTQMPCPAKGCCQGRIVTRVELGTAYSVGETSCAYCGGTGFTSPARHAAYLKLTRLTNL